MSFIRKIKTGSGIYRARVENRRVDGKVKQTVIEWLGKVTDPEETLDREMIKLVNQLDKGQKRLNQARDRLFDLQAARREAGRKALGGRYAGDIDDLTIDLTLRLLKFLSDRKWYSSPVLTALVGFRIRPELASRQDPKGKYNPDRGRVVTVTRVLEDLLLEKRIEKRRRNDRAIEWRLVDCAWAEQVLAKINAITA